MSVQAPGGVYMSSQCRSRKARVSLASCLISASLCDVSDDTFRLDTAEASLEEQGQWHVDSCGHLADQCPPSPTEFIGLDPMGQKGRMLFFCPRSPQFQVSQDKPSWQRGD